MANSTSRGQWGNRGRKYDMDEIKIMGNCSPTAPLSQNFAQGENLVSIFIKGRGRTGFSQNLTLTNNIRSIFYLQ